MATLSVRYLSFGYAERPVLKDIDFSVEEGAICGLLGPNGSGKTTLLKCISGFLKPCTGGVFIGGQAVAGLSRCTASKLLAVVPQMTALAFSFSALQIVVMGRVARLGAFAIPSRKDYRDAESILSQLGLSHLGKRGFNEMSGGERQMILLARALFQDPEILLLDEPTSHLDFKNQHLVLDRVAAVTREKNLTTLVTLHDPNLAVRYCSQMVMLKKGRIHRKGTRSDVFEADALESMYGMKVSVENGCRGNCYVIPSNDNCGTNWHLAD